MKWRVITGWYVITRNQYNCQWDFYLWFENVFSHQIWTLWLIGIYVSNQSIDRIDELCVQFALDPNITSGELRTQKLKSHVMWTRSLNVLPLKPGVGQYIAIYATLIARDFFLAYSTLPVHWPAFFPKPLLIFPVSAVANTWFLCRPAE